MVLLDTHYCPPIMFGDGEIMYIMSDWPYNNIPKYLKFYYMLSLSYYCEDMIEHIFKSPNFDYFEMILHHIITMMLIFCSYFNSFWNFGIFVLMQMDLADIFIGLIRVFMDFINKYITFLIYIGILWGFIHFRILAYVYCILFKFSMRARVSIDNYSHTVTIISILLVSLLALNIYWLILLLRMGFRLVFHGKAQDLQNVVTKKDTEM